MRILVFCLLAVTLQSIFAQTPSLTTDTISWQFPTTDEKLAFLQTYLNLPTDVEAIEYHIVFHDNSGGRVPGPSDWDMRVIVKVAPEDVQAWIESLSETDETFDLFWAHDLAKDWITSNPRFFTGDKRAALFEKEGVVVWWLSTLQ
jgi:hypothetical protein